MAVWRRKLESGLSGEAKINGNENIERKRRENLKEESESWRKFMKISK
jgi:hypothetical protein